MGDAREATEQGGPEYVLQGTNGIIESWSDRVVVRRQGGLRRLGTGFAKSERPIPYAEVQSVDVQWASLFNPGHMTFTLRDAEPPRRSRGAQRRDELAVVFKRRDNDIVREMKGYIEAHLDVQTPSGGQGPAPADDRVGQLERLARLHAEGQLTEQEFEAEKQRLG